MTIRICSGTYRSRKIECPVKGVRPTTDKVKQAVFSTIPFDLGGTHVLDLFAGSGNLGIEALSRGSSEVTFVDASSVCVRIIGKNLDTLQALDRAKIIRSDARAFLERCRETYDVIFMDPPYNKGLATELAPHVYKLLKTGGVLVIEHSLNESIPIKPWKTRTYGDTMITYTIRDES
jgi:16S rRNA (guanine966-N2)-methyltransferase